MGKKTIALKDLEVYKLAHQLGNETYEYVILWKHFDKETLGKQLIRSIDSISLNIAEGYGRYYYKENKQFCYYSRGSLYESADALRKAKERKLISEEIYLILSKKMQNLAYKVNNYITSIGNQQNNSGKSTKKTSSNSETKNDKTPKKNVSEDKSKNKSRAKHQNSDK
jgi:four helix bundle protein